MKKMSSRKNYKAREALARVAAIKGAINPETGRMFSNHEIAVRLGRSESWVRYVLSAVARDRKLCPKCLQPVSSK